MNMKKIGGIYVFDTDEGGDAELAMREHKLQKVKESLRRKHDEKVQSYVKQALEYNNLPVIWDNIKCRVMGIGYIFMYKDLQFLVASHMRFFTKQKGGKTEYQIHQDFVPLDLLDKDNMSTEERLKYSQYKANTNND